MEAVNELIERFGLEEDHEHVIIPLPSRNGKNRKCFLLKRRFMRIIYAGGRYINYPLGKVIEAIIKYPEMPVSEALFLHYEDINLELPEVSDNEEEPG